jgi:hypothetical protein
MQTKSVLMDNASMDAPTTTTTTTTALPPEEWNDIVDRASIVVWLGIYVILAVFLFLITLLLFFALTGLSFDLSIVEMVFGVILGVFAIFFATNSALSIAIFRVVALIFSLAQLAIAAIQVINFINFLTTDTTNAVTSVLIDILRITFTVVIAVVFFGLFLALYVEASHYAKALARKAEFESETVVVEDEETLPYPPEASAPPYSGVRRRGGFAVDIGKTK